MESFWSTEYGQNLLSVEQTEIDKLLSSPNTTTLEDLFDEDELLQQCSNKNTQLINFLSQRENITKLVSYITRPWQEHMQQIINHLKQQELNKQNENNNDTNTTSTDNDTNDNNNSMVPISKNGTSPIVGAIKEENNGDGQPTPQGIADALMSLENDDDTTDKKENATDKVQFKINEFMCYIDCKVAILRIYIVITL